MPRDLQATKNHRVKYGIALLLALLMAGCSSASFTRKDRPFDGTVHAASSLVCSWYWSNHGYKRKDKGRSFGQRIVPTAGLAVYSSVDLVSSFFFDLVLLPGQAIAGGPSVAPFDQVPHRIFPCGSIEHSINVVGGL